MLRIKFRITDREISFALRLRTLDVSRRTVLVLERNMVGSVNLVGRVLCDHDRDRIQSVIFILVRFCHNIPLTTV